MYDRHVFNIPRRIRDAGLHHRFETLIGVTGVRLAKYRMPLAKAFLEPLRIFWRPQLLGILIFEALLFGFGIGLNVSVAVKLAVASVVASTKGI
jgi:hypothetical protein